MKRLVEIALVAVVVAACGTLGGDDTTPADLPSAEMGPFRALQNKELKGTAPFVLDDSRAQYTDAAALADKPDGVVLYAVTGGKIVRTRALDGRTFYGSAQPGKTPPVVLTADQPWEGAALSGPFAFRSGPSVTLYYAAAGGVGVAHSTDGLRFTKDAGPILPGDVHGPSVFALPSGELRMLFATPSGIEEAASPDGTTWTRLPGPVLSASRLAGAFDAVAVADPCVATRITPAGRFHVRALYTGTSETGATAIGFAARYGESGALERNAQPTLPTGAQPAYAPPFLYTTQARGTLPTAYPAIAAAVEPLDATLGTLTDYPATP